MLGDNDTPIPIHKTMQDRAKKYNLFVFHNKYQNIITEPNVYYFNGKTNPPPTLEAINQPIA